MIFETPSDPIGERLLGKNEGVPNPYVLAPGWCGARVLEPNDELVLEITLVGGAQERADLVFAALVDAAAGGIGPDRVPLAFVDRKSVGTGEWTSPPERLHLMFTTPLRLMERGALVRAATFRPYHLLGSLARRVSLLAQYHQAGTFDLDFQNLRDRAAIAAFDHADIFWQDWARLSARQQAVIPMGGLMGAAVLPMAGLEPFWPLLRLAPALHIGKGATMGLGAITLASAD